MKFKTKIRRRLRREFVVGSSQRNQPLISQIPSTQLRTGNADFGVSNQHFGCEIRHKLAYSGQGTAYSGRDWIPDYDVRGQGREITAEYRIKNNEGKKAWGKKIKYFWKSCCVSRTGGYNLNRVYMVCRVSYLAEFGYLAREKRLFCLTSGGFWLLMNENRFQFDEAGEFSYTKSRMGYCLSRVGNG